MSTAASPSLATLLAPVAGRSGPAGLLNRGASNLWQYAKENPGQIALGVGSIALCFVPGLNIAGAAGMAAVGARLGIPLLGRGIAALGGRAVMRTATRLLGRTGVRGLSSLARNAPGFITNILQSAAKGVRAVAKGVTEAVGHLSTVVQHGGKMSTIMAGEAAPEAGGGGGQQASQEAEEPLPGERNRSAMEAAASVAAPSAPVPSTPARAPSAPTPDSGPSI